MQNKHLFIISTKILNYEIKNNSFFNQEFYKMKKHGLVYTPEYRVWSGMKQRCYNPKGPRFDRYGARGIKVCERWLNSFENFFTFGLTRDICTKEYLIDEIRDIRAKATNEIYNKNAEPKYQNLGKKEVILKKSLIELLLII